MSEQAEGRPLFVWDPSDDFWFLKSPWEQWVYIATVRHIDPGEKTERWDWSVDWPHTDPRFIPRGTADSEDQAKRAAEDALCVTCRWFVSLAMEADRRGL